MVQSQSSDSIFKGDYEKQQGAILTNTSNISMKKHFGYNIENGLGMVYKPALTNHANQRVLIYAVGDSLTRGLFSSVEYSHSWVALVRSTLQGLYGDAGEGCINLKESTLAETRYTLNANWAVALEYGFNGETYYSGAVTGTATLIFTATSITIPIMKYVNGGISTVTIDGSTVAPIDCTGGSTKNFTQFATYSGLSTASHTLVITPPAGGKSCYLEGIICNKGTTGVEMDRLGISGRKASDWDVVQNYQRWRSRPPHLAIIGLGVNDMYGFVSIASYTASMANLITNFKAMGSDVLLIVYHQCASSPGWYSYVKAMYTLADTYNCALIDLYAAFQMSWNVAQAMNFMGVTGATPDGTGNAGSNTTHLSDTGYSFEADIITPHLML